MQKVVFARETEMSPDLLIASQPTRGVDIGAIEYIHSELLRLRDAGKAILLISAELSEIRTLADRIIVLYEGEVVGEFASEDLSEREIGLYMTGSKRMDIKDMRSVTAGGKEVSG
jgi:simple sugar transport system ATP-binding protein